MLPSVEEYKGPHPEKIAAANTEHARTRLRKQRIASGICRDCGLLPPITDKVVCQPCFDKRKKTSNTCRLRKLSNSRCTQCGLSNDRIGKHLCADCSKAFVEKFRQTRKRNKLAVIEHFGGCCRGCKEIDPRVLTLHHIDGDGNEDRKSATSKKGRIDTPTFYARLYRLIIEHKPIQRSLELLCYNCHAKEDLAPWWTQ